MMHELQKAFLEDHRNLIGGLEQIRVALEAEDLPQAAKLARNLDEQVGPHIQFEEEVFYPALIEVLGPEFVGGLYREHSVGQRALASIMALEESGGLTPEKSEELAEQIEMTLKHALSCGTLLSHLAALSDDRRQLLLDKLKEIRDGQHLWTELPSRQGSGA